MMRHLRLLGLISIATLVLFAAPTAVIAQTPVQDQYLVPDDTGSDAIPAGDAGDDPVAVQAAARDTGAADTDGNLPFTGGSVPLVAMIGLALLAAGLVGAAATRKRHA